MSIFGPDVSNNNGSPIDWNAVKASGAALGICKATEGAGFVDWTYSENWSRMAQAGLERVAYHFAHPGSAAIPQQDLFTRTVMLAGFRPDDRVCLDLEVNETSAENTALWALQWGSSAPKGNHKPLLYCNLSMMHALAATTLRQQLIATFDLFIAYPNEDPSRPPDVSPWPTWTLFQYTWTASQPGIHGLCDRDVASGGFTVAPASAPPPPVAAPAAPTTVAIAAAGSGYRLLGSDGGVFCFQTAYLGGRGGQPASTPFVGIASTLSGNGYWLTDARGEVYAYGDAAYLGGVPAASPSAPIVGIFAGPLGGYGLVGADGGVFCFGTPFYGSLHGTPLAKPIVGAAAEPGGYRLVGADGGVFTYGAGPALTPLASVALAAPAVGITSPGGQPGIWIAGADGGVFAADDRFHGSMAGSRLRAPITGIAASTGGNGYVMAGADGGVFVFGDATFHGAL